jgi:hypothetical protein
MNKPFYRCEDCGHEFQQSGFPPDIEESSLAYPPCGALDIQLVDGLESTSGAEAF